MRSNMQLIVIVYLCCIGASMQQQQQLTENQNYLNYQQQQQQQQQNQQGRYLSSFPQNSRNGFLPVQQQQQQRQQDSPYQHSDFFLDGPSTPYNPFQSFAQQTTRSPNLFEISPRPFAVTTSPIQTRGQFSSSNFAAQSRQANVNNHNNFGLAQNYNFPSSAQQRQNPYLDSTGFGEVPISDDYGDRQPFIPQQQQPHVKSSLPTPRHHNTNFRPSSSSSSASGERVINDNQGNVEFNLPPRQSIKSNRERLRENLKGRPTSPTTTPETIVTTRRAPSRTSTSAPQTAAKKTKYTPVTRSTTSKRPQDKDQQQQQSKNSKLQSDQRFSLNKNERVKANNQDSFETPSHQYQISISHSDDEYDRNNFRVKTLEALKKEQSQEVDEEEYEDYDDEDYGVILTEEERAIRESTTTQQPVTTVTPPTTPTTTQKPEENTVIIFDNFILPGQNNNKQDDQNDQNEDDGIEYEYEYVDEDDEKPITTEKTPTTKSPSTKSDDFEITTYSRDGKKILGQAVVQVVTSKTVVNATKTESPEVLIETTTEEENYPSTRSPLTTPRTTTTEDYYVIASVQTSRSVSGAHFLPFDNVEQEEKKKSKIELKNIPNGKATTLVPETENVSSEVQDDDVVTSSSNGNDDITTTASSRFVPQPSTESIIDKLDKIQSELSLGVLSGEFPVLKDTSSKKLKVSTTTTTSTEAAAIDFEEETTARPFIRKFSPKSTIPTTPRTTTTQKVFIKSSSSFPVTTTTEESVTTTTESQRVNKKIIFEQEDDLAGLLPPGYKPRDSYKNKKLFTTTSTTTLPLVKEETIKSKNSSTAGRSYKPGSSSQSLPTSNGFKNFKNKGKATKTSEDNETENVPKKLLNKLFESSDDAVDISKFLPPDFKNVNKSEDKLSVIPLIDSDEKSKIKVVDDEDISKFLPADFKPVEDKKEKKDDVLTSILGKIKFSAPSDLLPSDFKDNVNETPIYVSTTETPSNNNGKLVFPSRFGAKKPQRSTTQRPHQASGPPPPDPGIRRGPPARATTEFTGWPSKATTPISIEKLLELQGGAERINFEDLLARSTAHESTTSTTTTTQTTTTTTTPRPTQPTVCRTECSLAATIRIVDGVEWSPELLTHHTSEYKKLAKNLEDELNSIYSNAPELRDWFRKVKIDSFSKGSVLVDYFVELAEVPKEINTQEIKSLFHQALLPAHMKEQQSEESVGEGSPQPIIKEAFKLGNYVVDPVSTDFIVIQKVATQRPDIEEDNLLPQWAVAMITIGCLSLVFVILFGVAVLVNKKKAAKKKPPTPLTADMLNELNKNHMGGLENYGAEDLYNLDDTWDERRQDVKPKVKRFSTTNYDNNPNIYDSWRSQHLERYQPDYDYYDSHDPFNDLQQPKYHHQQQQQTPTYGGGSSSSKRYAMEPQWHESAYAPYHINNKSHNYSSRRLRDYDQHF